MTTYTIKQIEDLGGTYDDINRVYIDNDILNIITGKNACLSNVRWLMYVDVPTGNIYRTNARNNQRILAANINGLKVA